MTFEVERKSNKSYKSDNIEIIYINCNKNCEEIPILHYTISLLYI